MIKIAVVGAGHAGVAAALEASKLGADVSLFSAENSLPYYRPKITSVAFRQLESTEILIHPLEWYNDNKIKLLLNNKVEKIDPVACTVSTSCKQNLKFDIIIITTGAYPIVPKFAREAVQEGYASTLWTIKDALLIRNKIGDIKKLAIIGGGVIGIECSLRASDNGIKVTIIEKGDYLMQRNLSSTGSQALKRVLINKGIQVLTSATVETISQANGKAAITVEKELLCFDHIILSIGCLPNTTSLLSAADSTRKGIHVNNYMESEFPNIYSAGDSAVITPIAPPSVQNAISQGKIAGHNASSLENLLKLQSTPISVDVKYKDFELHSAGCFDKSPQRIEEVLEESENTYRSLLKDGEKIAGIQMIGSSEDFNLFKKLLDNTLA